MKISNLIGILLGGGIRDEGTLPHDVENRVDKAYTLLHDGKIRWLICSGGRSNPNVNFSEAKIMAKKLVRRGIKSSALLLEEQSRDTIGNAVFSKELILKKKLKGDIILITSNYHMPRALRIFQHVFGEGWRITGLKSYSPLIHKFRMLFREWEEKEIETAFLEAVPLGNHGKARKFITECIEKYKDFENK